MYRMGVHSDLAREMREIFPDIACVEEEIERRGAVSISRIRIKTEAAAERLEKPVGTYITMEAPQLVNRDTLVFKEIGALLSEELLSLLKDDGGAKSVLVVGLGNKEITADALGPAVVAHTFVTRHITLHMPDIISEPVRAVSAVAPGVLGTTGMETLEVLSGIVEHVRPDIVVAVDALASRRAARISTAIQLTDTGIHPGSGVGNGRSGLTQETLGVPIIAIGVPTVVYASTILHDAIALIAERTGMQSDAACLRTLADELVCDHMGAMIVTPKDIDTIIADMAGILADGINLALHKRYYRQIEELLA